MSCPSPSYRSQRNRGQALVELALILPLLLLILFGIMEFGRIFHAYLTVTNASREGARIAIVGYDDHAIIDRVVSSASSLDIERLTTSITPPAGERKRGNYVTVEVSYSVPLITPIIDQVIPNPFPVRAATTMRVE